MKTVEQIENYRKRLQESLTRLIKYIGPIQIGNKKQFPYGWRKSAKGRTVWRILEEAINQNLELKYKDFGLSEMKSSDSEVSVYDSILKFQNDEQEIYFNVKSSVANGKTSKDDISKAIGLLDFFSENIERLLFIATFEIEFNNEMSIEFKQCHVMPITWLPDVYVNPSNNGNLQSSYYKDLARAKQRLNSEFIEELKAAMKIADEKRQKKR